MLESFDLNPDEAQQTESKSRLRRSLKVQVTFLGETDSFDTLFSAGILPNNRIMILLLGQPQDPGLLIDALDGLTHTLVPKIAELLNTPTEEVWTTFMERATLSSQEDDSE